MFAFEIQCNAFVPVFLLLYVVQFMLLPLLLQVIPPVARSRSFFALPSILPVLTSFMQPGILPLLFSNTLYAAAASW